MSTITKTDSGEFTLATTPSTTPTFHNYEGRYDKVICGHSQFTPEMFFYLRTNEPPKIITYVQIEAIKALHALCKEFEIDLKYSISHQMVNLESSKRTTYSMIVQLEENVVASLAMNYHDLMILHTENVSPSVLNTIEEIAKQYAKNKITNCLQLLVYEADMGGFRLNEFSLPQSDFDIESHYNDDFLPINDLILNRLSEDKSKGIVLLHGEPGTGKTSYIRYLIRNLKKNLIYIPTNLAHRLGDPDFLPFLVDQNDSILIIEDAEEILKERSGGSNGTIANLLNLGDGLLSDCLHIQIICTFNAPLTRIDKALLRKGRVIASYEFKPLTIQKSNTLLKSLDSDYTTTKEMTLAEIFYQKDQDFLMKGEGIGFGR